jgi:Flp pilus assembly protein CpaB
MTEVLVASSDLTQGQALNEAALRWQPWPMNAISPASSHALAIRMQSSRSTA